MHNFNNARNCAPDYDHCGGLLDYMLQDKVEVSSICLIEQTSCMSILYHPPSHYFQNLKRLNIYNVISIPPALYASSLKLPDSYPTQASLGLMHKSIIELVGMATYS